MADEIIGSVGVEIRGDYSNLGADFDAAVALAVASGSTLAEAIQSALKTPDTTPVTDAFAKVGEAATLAGEQLGLFGDVAQHIPWADESGQMNLFADAIEPIGKNAQGAADGINQVGQAASNATGPIHEASIGLDDLTGALLKAAGIQFGLAQIKDFGEQILAVAADVERFTVAMTALTGSAAGAGQALAFVRQFSLSGAFAFTDVEKAVQQFTALGFSAAETQKALTAAGNAAKAMGSSINSTSSVLERMVSSGMVMSRTLVTLGLNMGDLAAALGTTEDQAKKAFKALDESERLNVLTSALGKFNGIAQESANTLSGAWTNAQNQMRLLLGDIGSAIAPAATAIVQFVSGTVIPYLRDFVEAFTAAGFAVKQLASTVGELLSPLTSMISSVKEAAAAVPGLGSALKDIYNVLSTLTSPLQMFLSALRTMAAGVELVTGKVPGLTAVNNALTASIKANTAAATEAGLKLAAQGNAVTALIDSILAQQQKLAGNVSLAKQAYDQLSEAYKTGTPLANGYKVTSEDVARALANLTAATAAAATTTQVHADKIHGAVLAHRDMQDAVRLLVDQIKIEFDYFKKISEETAIANMTLGTHLTTLDMLKIKTADANVTLKLFSDNLYDIVEKGAGIATLSPLIQKTTKDIDDLGKQMNAAAKIALDTSPYAKLGEAFHTLGLTGINAFDGVEKKGLSAFETIAKSADTTLPEIEAAWGAVSGRVNSLAKTDIPGAIRIQEEYIQALQRTGASVGQITAAQEALLKSEIALHTEQGKGSNAEIIALQNMQMRTKALEAENNFLGNTYVALMKDFDNAFTTLGNNIAAGIAQGKSFGEVWHNTLQAIEQQILTTVINAILKLAENWLITMIAGRTESATAGVGEIMTSAAVGAAAAAASTAAIPIIGPALAPAAAAAMYAEIAAWAPLASLDRGGIIPDDMLAMVHKDEMVLPADISTGLRNMIAMTSAPEMTNPAQVIGGALSASASQTSNASIVVNVNQPRIGAGFTPREVSQIFQEGISQAKTAGAFRFGVFPAL